MKTSLFALSALAFVSQTPAWAEIALPQTATGESLTSPTGVGTAKNGNVYVADNGKHAIYKYGPDGHQEAFWKQNSTNAVYSLAVDKAENIYFGSTDGTIFKAERYQNAYIITSLVKGLVEPSGVAVDSNGNVYVADKKAGTVLKYDGNSGQQLAIVATNLSKPEGVAVDGNNTVYFTTSGDKKVWKATFQPEMPTAYHPKTIVETGLQNPTGIAVDNAGNLCLTDRDNGIVNKYSPNGELQMRIAEALKAPIAVAIDGTKTYVAANKQILKFDSAGVDSKDFTIVRAIAPQNGGFKGIAVSGGGNLYVSDASVGVHKWSPDGRQLADPISSGNPSAISVDKYDSIYFNDVDKKSTFKLWSQREWTTFAEGINKSSAVLADACNFVYLIANGSTLRGYNGADRNGWYVDIAEVGLGTKYGDVKGVAADRRNGNVRGDVYFVTASGVWRARPAAGVTYQVELFAGSSSDANGIAVDDYGNVYVIASGNGRGSKLTIHRYRPDGKPFGDIVPNLLLSQGLAVDSAGNIYVLGAEYFLDRETTVWKLYPYQVFAG